MSTANSDPERIPFIDELPPAAQVVRRGSNGDERILIDEEDTDFLSVPAGALGESPRNRSALMMKDVISQALSRSRDTIDMSLAPCKRGNHENPNGKTCDANGNPADEANGKGESDSADSTAAIQTDCHQGELGPEGELGRKNSFKYPLHSAAEKGHVKELEKLLQNGDPLQLDFKQRTPLHYACGCVYQKKALLMVEAILKCPKSDGTIEDPGRKMRLINYQDKKGETGLHIAARTGHPEVVIKLLFAAADVNLKDNNRIEPLQLIYSRVPSAMIPVLDGAVACKIGDQNDQNLLVNFDFGSIVGYLDPDQDNSFYQLETKLLSYCLQHQEKKRSAILLHPVVQTFLFFKWKKIRILLWMSILYHVIWLLLYTLFIVHTYLIECPYRHHADEADAEGYLIEGSHSKVPDAIYLNETEISANNGSVTICDIQDHFGVLVAELSMLLVVTCSVALKELYEISSSPRLEYYCFQLENLGQWLLITVVLLTTIPVYMKETILSEEEEMIFIRIHAWQYQASAFGIFLAWTLILSQIGKIPRFGIYIEILAKVLKSVVMLMITFASLVVAFTVAFQILMPTKVAFRDFPWGFMKIMVMMVGELNYEEVFYDEETSSEVPFPVSTKLLYGAFVAMITIILFNLLIGLTVSDIQGLQSVARLSSLSSQLEQIYLMEKFVISKKVQLWLKRFNKNHLLRYFLVTQQHDDVETNMGVDIHVAKIPKDLQHLVREKAVPSVWDPDVINDEKDSTEPDVPTPVSALTNDDLKQQIKIILLEILEEMKSKESN